VSPTYDHALEGFFGPTFLDPVMLKAVQPRAVHVTRPSCYGICPDIAGLVGLSGLLDIPLIVDEAHGSHFPFHDGLPPSALTMGADVVIHSLHKTLGSLTQSSMLHLNRLRVSPARIERALEMVQSSSPSALLLLSLDLASTQMVERGNSLMEVLLALSETTRGEINNIDGLHCYGAELLGRPGIDGFDPTKLIVDLAETGQSGFACAQWLMANRGIGVEFSDHRRVVCTLTLADTEASTQALVDGLRAFVEALPEGSSLIGPGDGLAHLPAWPRMELTPRQAMQAPIDEVPRHLAVDRISAEYVIPYPPGIPLLVPGELITGEILEYVGHVQMAGGQVMGTADPTAARLRVLSA
jgi:arginine/lysine/ornithine decarboxylase